jgi:hypothetical protein
MKVKNFRKGLVWLRATEYGKMNLSEQEKNNLQQDTKGVNVTR